LKTETARTAVPIPQRLALSLAAHVERHPAETVLPGEAREQVGPWALERAVRHSRAAVDGLADGFWHHGDLRHYFASLLIASGADVKTVPGAATARLGEPDAGHLRQHVARPRRVDGGGRGSRSRRS
jgi:hypothetical protein